MRAMTSSHVPKLAFAPNPEGVLQQSPGLPLWATLGYKETPKSTLKGLDKASGGQTICPTLSGLVLLGLVL